MDNISTAGYGKVQQSSERPIDGQHLALLPPCVRVFGNAVCYLYVHST
jgi:hypothetical protein